MATSTNHATPRTASRGARLKQLISAPEILVSPGVYDGYSARLVEKAGFQSASITGAGTSESRLGWADRGVMGLEENLANARRLADCTNLLLRADADTGYGNPINMRRTIRDYEKSGVAGVHIEDQSWPKRCGLKGRRARSGWRTYGSWWRARGCSTAGHRGCRWRRSSRRSRRWRVSRRPWRPPAASS